MRSPFRAIGLIEHATLAVCLFQLVGFGQTTGTGPTTPSNTPTLHTEAQLVAVNVTVHDKNGHPVHGLKREDFTVTESNQPQAVRYFEECSAQMPISFGQDLPPMPPGTFSDYTPVPPKGALNVLLIDSLNTSMADQAYVRSQLQQYVKKAMPGTRIAIFGLSRKLFMLQGFNSDPHVIKNAVEHKLLARASSLLDDPAGAGNTLDAPSDITATLLSGQQDTSSMQLASIVSNMQQFEAEQAASATELRVQYTLDAFNTLAHYLSAFPGRKNVIWFSGSFPINILPDPALESGARGMESNDAGFRETTSLLSHAQVAVYPVDARGLVTDPTFSAATKSDPFGKSSAAFYQSQSSEHTTMSQLAEDTGGKAFYNTNDLSTAVRNAIEAGSNYYTLSYQPSNRVRDGRYREIHVVLNGNLRAAGYYLAYRHGYFIDDHSSPSKNSTAGAPGIDDVLPLDSRVKYVRLAMSHGAPTPEEILFKVRVLPIGSAPEQELARNNLRNSARPLKPPFRRFAVDLAAIPDAFQLTLDKDGNLTGAIEFSVILYDNDGTALNATGKTVQLNFNQEGYHRFLSGVNGHFEISVPVKASADFLRIGIYDIPSNRMGVVEVPVASVERLKPLPAP